VGLDIGEDIDFVDGALLEFFILFELGYGDDLDGVLLLIVVVDGTINLTVDSGTDRLV
jgi:hypothetical protein